MPFIEAEDGFKEFVINENTWNSGCKNPVNEVAGVALLNVNGSCCLGFFCLAAGYSEDEIRDHSTPRGVVRATASEAEQVKDDVKWLLNDYEYPSSMTLASNATCEDIVDLNDKLSITQEHRKAQLIHAFGRHKYRPVFVKE